MYIYIQIHIYAGIYIYLYAYVYMYVYIYMCIYDTHMYIDTQRHRQQCGVSRRERMVGGGGGGQRWWGMRTEGDFAWGNGYIMHDINDILLNCILETWIAL